MEPGWQARLAHGDVVLLDGGTASELRRRGFAMHRDAWSAPAARSHAKLLESVHRDYIRAGADVITTNTFATSRFVLEAAGLGNEFDAINHAAVDAAIAARRAVDRPIAVAGSISCLPPRFDPRAYPPEAVELEAYRELATLLVERGADLIALEMIQDASHGSLALVAAIETGLPVWLGISVRRLGHSLVAYDDAASPIDTWLASLVDRGPTVVNVMHTRPDDVDAALTAVRRVWRGPLGVYPELGEDDADPGTFVASAVRWVTQGARLIGGCCGTGPEHIAALARSRARLLAARARV